MSTGPSRLQRSVFGLLSAALVAIGLWVALPLAAAADVSLDCDGEAVVYGTAVTCSSAGGVALRWPDGSSSTVDAAVSPNFVGTGAIELIGSDGETLASSTLAISPDIDLECTERDGDLKRVFQLEVTETRAAGWDYVYRDIATGELVHPGDPSHPSGGTGEGLERVELGQERSTGLCRLHSNAAEALDGDYRLEIESPWEPAQTTPMRIIGPSSKTQWAGTQPAELTGTVTVNNVSASERVGVYQSGCS